MVPDRSRNRAGFTLVELLVVIAIIGILVALLLPGLNSARESSRRMQCQNKLKQLGTAAKSYMSRFGSFPSASAGGHTFVVRLLPHLEQEPLYDQFNLKKSWSHADNQLAVNTQLPAMNCPSTPGSGQRIDEFGSGKTCAAGDYAPTTSFTQTLVNEGFIPPTARKAGAMTNLGVKEAWIRDGTSTTILLTEDAGRPEYWTSRGQGPLNEPEGGGSFSGGNFTVVNGRVRGAGWADTAMAIPMHGFLPDGSDTPGPCAMNCTNNNEAFAFHRGGINAVFADGGVRFLSETMEMAVFAAMITRDGGEVVPADAY